MIKPLLLLALAVLPASAADLTYVSFAEIKASVAAADVAAVKRTIILLDLLLADEDEKLGSYPIEDRDVKFLFVMDSATQELIRRLPWLKDLEKGVLVIPAAQTRDRFEETRQVYCQLIAEAAKADPASEAVKTLARWGLNTWVQTDSAIELHSERILSQTQYDALKLK